MPSPKTTATQATAMPATVPTGRPPPLRAGPSGFVVGPGVFVVSELGRLAMVVRAVTVWSRRPTMLGSSALGSTCHSPSDVGHAGGELDGVYTFIDVPAGFAVAYTAEREL